MKEEDTQSTGDIPTRTWAILAGISLIPVYLLFDYFGEPGRGEAAAVCGIAIALAVRWTWNLRKHAWFWVAVALIVALHIPFIALIPWPFKQEAYIAVLPIAFIDFLIVCGIIRLAEKAVARMHGHNDQPA